MSFLQLKYPSRRHDIFDDLESLLWVLLFLAIRRFKYQGDFDMLVFEEAREIPDEKQGIVSVGGDSKLLWLYRPDITFECKPLQDFFDSFRNFHGERYTKLSLSRAGGAAGKDFEEFEAAVRNDVYSLLPHFDNILNDPDADWTGQEVDCGSPAQARRNRANEAVRDSDDTGRSLPESGPELQQRGEAKKRKREAPGCNDEPRRKRIMAARGDNNGGQGDARTIRTLRRRKDPVVPTPTDRALRPRTRK